jgi:hypothetical protein
MADYYPVLARAVSSLSNNTAQARRELYERARRIVIDQLRQRDPDEVKPETARERAALEAAIRRVETELRAARSPAEARRPPPLPLERPAASTANPAAKPAKAPAGHAAAAQPKPAASYLAKILQALQPSDNGEKAPRQPDRAKTSKKHDDAIAPAPAVDDPDDAPAKETGELGGMLHSLATMMLALTYCVAALAFTGVVYFRGSVMVTAGIIGYPVLLLMMTAVVCLFVIPPWALFRKTSGPTIGFLFRAIHSASRQAS